MRPALHWLGSRRMRARRTAATLIAAASLAVALPACGSDDEEAKQDAREEVEKGTKEGKEGIDEVRRELEREGGLPDDAQKQLDDAEKQLDDAKKQADEALE